MISSVTAALIVIGDEILSGRTRDANLAFLATRLAELGIPLAEARVVPDREAAIVEAVNALRERHTYVFTTGGIGPTHDDITAASVAKAFGVALERNQEAQRRLESHYVPGQLNAARLRMADVPAGAALLDNPVSKAPGFRIGNVHVLPGVPNIMQPMFDLLAPSLTGGMPIVSRSIACFLPEGALAEGLAAVQAANPDVAIGSYPHFGRGQTGTTLVMRGTDAARLGQVAGAIASLIGALGGSPNESPEGGPNSR